MVVVGRQRVGKTSFLNALAQYLQERGAEFAIWDTDQMNTTNNMSVFHAEASSPPVRSAGRCEGLARGAVSRHCGASL